MCEENSNFPRVLVISNNCFSQTDSNGRTLGNFFKGWDKNRLAQFYIHSEIPDENICINYFKVTDSEALKSLFSNTNTGMKIDLKYIMKQKEKKTFASSDIKKRKFEIKRTAMNLFIRDLVWGFNKWKSEKFEKWLREVNPEVIVLQAGDCKFMIDLAITIARDRKIPLVVYNSESYYLKEKNYLKKSIGDFIFYPLFKKNYDKSFEKLMKIANHTIYNTELLERDYNKKFDSNSSVLMTSSEIIKEFREEPEGIFTSSYLGNLGLGRDESLIEIATCIGEIDSTLKLDVYGPVNNNEVLNRLNKCKFIDYKGMVSYQDVLKVINESNLLVHVENFSNFYRWDLKYGFSTKIADSLSSSRCFFVYAPEEIASSKYLRENELACVVEKKDKLKNSLEKIILDKELRKKYIINALEYASKNHDEEKNKRKFRKIIESVVKKRDEGITS